MKRKLIMLSTWIVMSILYVILIADTGRAIGAQINDAVENYVEYYTQEYIGAEGMVDSLTNAWSYSTFDNLSEDFKRIFVEIAVMTVIYIIATVVCYHYAFIKKRKNTDDDFEE